MSVSRESFFLYLIVWIRIRIWITDFYPFLVNCSKRIHNNDLCVLFQSLVKLGKQLTEALFQNFANKNKVYLFYIRSERAVLVSPRGWDLLWLGATPGVPSGAQRTYQVPLSLLRLLVFFIHFILYVTGSPLFNICDADPEFYQLWYLISLFIMTLQSHRIIVEAARFESATDVVAVWCTTIALPHLISPPLSSVADPDPWDPYHFPGSRSV